MRFRRRFATGGRLTAMLDALRNRFHQLRHAVTDQPDATGTPAGSEPVEPPTPGGDDAGDASRDVFLDWQRWAGQHRRALWVTGTFGVTFVVGYLLAALVFFPAPFLAAHHSVPRVLGESLERARTTLEDAGFTVGEVERAPHPTIPAGAVIWQDPPADVIATDATEVQLTVSSGPQRVPVPDVAGYDAEDARMLLESAGLRVGGTESTQAPTPRNVAVNTRPPAGSTLSPGSEVVLVVSVGAATIRVPNLVGLTVDEARLALETAGLALGTVFSQTTSAVAPGEIFYQEPSGGNLSAPGTAVNVRLARSP